MYYGRRTHAPPRAGRKGERVVLGADVDGAHSAPRFGIVVADGRLGLSERDRATAVAGGAMTAARPQSGSRSPRETSRPPSADLIAGGGRMHMAYAWRPAPGALELRYLASISLREDFIVWRCAPSGKVPSVAGISPLLGWYEREISDLFGVEFVGHPEPHRLVLHQGARPIAPPMSSAYPADVEMPFESIESRVPELANPDVQRLPFGPVRADVVESAELIFFYVGEHILHFHPQLFFKHRGMEKR